MFSRLYETKQLREVRLSKNELQDLLKLAQSDRERECVRYAVWKASGLSAKGARKHFGFGNITERAEKVSACLEEIKTITRDVEEMCKIQETAMLTSLNLISKVYLTSLGPSNFDNNSLIFYPISK